MHVCSGVVAFLHCDCVHAFACMRGTKVGSPDLNGLWIYNVSERGSWISMC